MYGMCAIRLRLTIGTRKIKIRIARNYFERKFSEGKLSARNFSERNFSARKISTRNFFWRNFPERTFLTRKKLRVLDFTLTHLSLRPKSFTLA